MIDDADGKAIRVVAAWARGCDDIRAVVLVGSHARNAARRESDIDLVLLVSDSGKFFKDSAWLEAIDWQSVGLRPLHFRDARYGACTSRHVALENGLEVEFGFVCLSWADCFPVDPGTRQVVSDGCRVLYDPDKRMTNLLAACRD
jgi:uncharacterized protein